jgi:hypothetical protein
VRVAEERRLSLSDVLAAAALAALTAEQDRALRLLHELTALRN